MKRCCTRKRVLSSLSGIVLFVGRSRRTNPWLSGKKKKEGCHGLQLVFYCCRSQRLVGRRNKETIGLQMHQVCDNFWSDFLYIVVAVFLQVLQPSLHCYYCVHESW